MGNRDVTSRSESSNGLRSFRIDVLAGCMLMSTVSSMASVVISIITGYVKSKKLQSMNCELPEKSTLKSF